jgi:hypothetical protein
MTQLGLKALEELLHLVELAGPAVALKRAVVEDDVSLDAVSFHVCQSLVDRVRLAVLCEGADEGSVRPRVGNQTWYATPV